MNVWIQKWEESERGWGTRPDGYTVHSSRGDVDAFFQAMRASEAEKGHGAGNPPDEYSRPVGSPYEAKITDQALVDKLEASEHGCWGSGGNAYPPSIHPGADRTGWITMAHRRPIDAGTR